MTKEALHFFLASVIILGGCSSQPDDNDLQPVNFEAEDIQDALGPLGRAIGESQVVLLGENGHGVGEFSEAKVQLIEWLYENHGFEMVIFESGFFECEYTWQRLDSLSTTEALRSCLRYPFEHAEILPLFDLMKERRSSERPLVLAGMDLQAQGFDSEPRPAVLHGILETIEPSLANALATVDSALYLAPSSGGRGDDLYQWAFGNRFNTKILYHLAATQTEGWAHWTFRLAGGWIDRLAVRGEAELKSVERPAPYYELRDAWMAHAVAAHADSISGARKVIVWLHNEHAAYGSFQVGEHRIRSTGSYLREWYGDRVFSVGFFMGEGSVADNGRNSHRMAIPYSNGIENYLATEDSPASYLILRDNSNPRIRDWADGQQTYLRMGLKPITIVPADEFDALLYIDSVSPPDYNLR